MNQQGVVGSDGLILSELSGLCGCGALKDVSTGESSQAQRYSSEQTP